MTNDPSAQVTQLLKNYCNGNREALKELLPLIYNQLHKLARQQRYFQRKDHTLNSTALVHEAYLKLVNHPDPSWENRTHFLRVAARAMRQILVDYARRQQTAKRGGGEAQFSLNQTSEFPLEERIQTLREPLRGDARRRRSPQAPGRLRRTPQPDRRCGILRALPSPRPPTR